MLKASQDDDLNKNLELQKPKRMVDGKKSQPMEEKQGKRRSDRLRKDMLLNT